MVFTPSILLPLYLYPSPNAWNPLYTALRAHPTVPVDVVINPGSGPQYYPPSFPDTNWLNALITLATFPQVRTLGYVPLTWGSRDASAVAADIDAYAYWDTWRDSSNASSTARVRINGVFLDETPSSTGNGSLALISGAASRAHSMLPAPAAATQARVVLNPGVFVAPSVYALADEVVAFEQSWARYEEFAAVDPFNGTVAEDDVATRRKSTFVVHTFDGSVQDMRDLVQDLIESDLGGLYVETGSDYTAFGALWSDFVAAVDDNS